MLDLEGIRNYEQATEEDVALHSEVATIAALVERYGLEGITVENVGIEELRGEGLSSASIEFVLTATPSELRSVLGAHAAYIVKMHRGGIPNGGW